MPTVAVIPVKSFSMGKQRLAAALHPGTRARLGQALADHVATTAMSAGLLPLVVTADPDVAAWSTLAGIPSVPDAGEGLDAAASAGVEWAARSASRWIVVHSDLPLVTPSDLSVLDSALDHGQPVIAPSADGGTSAVGWTRSFGFHFGVSSFHRHLASLRDPVVVTRSGLLLDLDSPSDLEAAMSTRRGAWIRDLIGG